jgi:hypothetical protein
VNDWIPIGTHQLRIEDDLAYLRINGDINPPDTKGLLEHFQRVHQQKGHLFLLFDAVHAGTISAESRRMFIEWNRTYPIAAVVNFGGGMVQKALAVLLHNAIRIMTKKAPLFAYLATEAEARKWLDEQRRTLFR